jgi:hypothetical protein
LILALAGTPPSLPQILQLAQKVASRGDIDCEDCEPKRQHPESDERKKAEQAAENE